MVDYQARIPIGRPSRIANIETPDQPVLNPENMADHFVRQQLALDVAHGLMDLGDDLPVRAGREAQWLYTRVDHRPLARPIASDALASVDGAAPHAIGPHNIRVHHRDPPLYISRLEAPINSP